MSEITKIEIGDHALLVSFIRVKMGKEFEVADRLSDRFNGWKSKASYYTCYGQYDLVEFLMVDSFETVHTVPFHEEITDFESSLFCSWETVSYGINEWAKGAPALLLVLLKTHPGAQDDSGLVVERDIINYVRRTLPDDPNIFGGLGRSDILVLLRGSDLEKMLESVSSLRQTTKIGDVTEAKQKSKDGGIPIFIDSMTFPLIAHPALQKKEGYSHLHGNIKPIVSVVCNPGYEGVVAQKRLPSSAGAYNVYGNYDVTIIWKDEVPLSRFAEEITDFRNHMGKMGGIKSTSTMFLAPREILGTDSAPVCCDFKQVLVPETAVTVKNLGETINPIIKARVIEFLSRLNSYYTQQEFNPSFDDMAGVPSTINLLINQMREAPPHEQHQLFDFVLEVIDLSNNGIHQRYSGLESRFDTCKHLPYPFLQCINGFIAAASCIPCFVFKAMFPDIPLKQSWPGFVLFGPSYSYQLQAGRVLSYPASSLLRPVEDWLGITHEVGHAVYRAMDFYDTILPDEIKECLSRGALEVPGGIRNFMDEVYANWFDFKYIFGGDKDRYFQTIWRYWLQWKRVWSRKADYLLRSFIAFLTIDPEGFRKAHNQGYDEETEYYRSQYDSMTTLIASRVSHFREFHETVTARPDKIKEIIRIADTYNLSLLPFLQYKHFDTEAQRRTIPHYPPEALAEHVRALSRGSVITDNIPNPVQLLYELYDKHAISGKPVSLKLTAVTVLTLWLKYNREYRS